jgi:hypothetical protein
VLPQLGYGWHFSAFDGFGGITGIIFKRLASTTSARLPTPFKAKYPDQWQKSRDLLACLFTYVNTLL